MEFSKAEIDHTKKTGLFGCLVGVAFAALAVGILRYAVFPGFPLVAFPLAAAVCGAFGFVKGVDIGARQVIDNQFAVAGRCMRRWMTDNRPSTEGADRG